MFVAVGQHAHRPTCINETNTTASCDASGAPDTGPVFASALWSLDWILRTASAGVTGLNFHGSFGGVRRSRTARVYAKRCGKGTCNARPEFYGPTA
jgi:hypothetical protein